jgi:hypothetical protein
MIPKTNIRDSYYKFYRLPISGETKFVDRETYLKIVSGFIKFIVKKALDGFFVKLSGGGSLGAIGIVGKIKNVFIDKEGEIAGASVDGRATTDLWNSNPEAKEKKQLIYHLNEHTNGIAYRWVWSTTDMKIANKRLYSLSMTKGPNSNRRAIARMIKDHDKEYYVMSQKFNNYGYIQ